jgi:hypothetical protein
LLFVSYFIFIQKISSENFTWGIEDFISH